MLRRAELTALDIAYVGSYPPRKCGIATFTHDLLTAIEEADSALSTVVAVNDRTGGYDYDWRVKVQIDRDDLASYIRAAQILNRMPIQLVNVQHEYGLFGGAWGDYLLLFYRRLERPVVTTLHTTLPNPDPTLRRVTREIALRSRQVVVLARAAVDILARDYGIPRRKIRVLPHGVPTVQRWSGLREQRKAEMGCAGRKILSTFGLINPNKGIEYVLRALPEVIEAHPEVLYLVIGETHPGVRYHSGESYRESLLELCRELGIEEHVAFVDRYLTRDDLVRYLELTDVYLMPYLNPHQIVSGTLAYALGAGKAVVATPFVYAREVLADGRGVIVPFRDSAAIARAVVELLGDPERLLALEERAYAYTRSWTWPAVGRQYLSLFREVIRREVATLEVGPPVAPYRQLRRYPTRPVHRA